MQLCITVVTKSLKKQFDLWPGSESSFLEVGIWYQDSFPGQRSNRFFSDFVATMIHRCTNFFKNNIYSLRHIFLACFWQGNMHALVAICKNKEFYGKGHRMVKNQWIKMLFFSKMFQKCCTFTSLNSIALNLINYHQ